MSGRMQALRTLIQDPSSNFAATGAAIAVVVVFVIVLALILIAFALPGRSPATTEQSSAARRRKMPRWLATLGGTAVLVVGVLAALAWWYQATSTPTYCTRTCHAMAAPTQTWTTSAHAQVPCVRCHEGKPWESMPAAIAQRSYSLYLEVTGSNAKRQPVPMANCLNCHVGLLDEQLTGRNGEPFAHRELLGDYPDCTACHGKQGHEPPRM